MSKITYTFDSIEEAEDNKIFAQSVAMHSILHELSVELRAKCKYEKPTKADEHWKNRLNELLTEYEVELF